MRGRGRFAAPALLVALALGFVFSSAATAGAGGNVRAHQNFAMASLPRAARVPVSNALGTSARGYAVRTRHGALVLTNSAQRLRATFDRSGAHFQAGTTRLGLGLVGVGAGAAMRSFSAVTPTAAGNRVSYVGRGLSESFVNGPAGVEQTFTVARQAPGNVLSLALALSGNVRARIGKGGQAATFAAGPTAGFRYTGLAVKDARGRSLHAWLAIHETQLLIKVDVRHARYPITVDPLIQQGSELFGFGESSQGRFGSTVALSSDGNTALVGAPQDANGFGSAFVFTRSGGTWSQQAKLYASCTINCANEGTGENGHGNFGSALALSADGNTAAIGAPADSSSAGAVWVFTRSGSAWTQQTELVANCTSSCDNQGTGENTSFGSFGSSVALSSDGLTLLAGAPNEDHLGNGLDGAAWVFTRSGAAWSQQDVLVADCTASCAADQGSGEDQFGRFGQTVALSSLGGFALIGAPQDLNGDGSAWVFTRSGTNWSFGSKLTGDGAGEIGAGNFGSSISLSPAATTALIGAPQDNSGEGAAWVFTRVSLAWSVQTELTGGCTSSCAHQGTGEIGNGAFGESASLSSDGNRAIIGARGDALGLGAAWTFTRSAGAWTQDGEKLVADCDFDPSADCTYQGTGEVGYGQFGSSAAVSGDGHTIVVGGWLDNNQFGSAWVFTPVVPVAPAVTQESSSLEFDLGSSFTDTVTVHGDDAHGGPPSGTVKFYVCELTGPGGCSSNGTFLGSVSVIGGSATSPAFKPIRPKTYCFYASYGGDGHYYLPSADGGRDGCVRVSLPSTAHPTFVYKSAVGGSGSDPGEMSGPKGVALDAPSRTLYVADTGNSRVEQFGFADNGLGGYAGQIAGPGSADGQVDAPLGMTYDRSRQNLYVVDSDPTTGDPRVEVFGPSGFKSSIGSGGSVGCTTFEYPFGVATDTATGALYVTDQGFNVPHLHEFNGSSCQTVGDGQLGYSSGVAVDPQSGYVYVADQQNDQILVFGPNGDFRFQFGAYGSDDGQFDSPAGIAVDGSTGNVYVADAGNNRIEVFSPRGQYLSQFGSVGSGSGELENPTAVAVDTATGYAYVADTGNDRVEVFAYVQPPPPPKIPGGNCPNGQQDGATFALVHIQGCLTPTAGGYTTTNPIFVNGVPLSLPNPLPPGAKFVITTPKGGDGGSIGVGGPANTPMAIYLGGGKDPILNKSLTLQLPADNADHKGQVKDLVGDKVVNVTADTFSLLGIDISGNSFSVSVGKDARGYFSTFTLDVSLPEGLQKATGGGSAQGQGSLRVDDDGVVEYNGMLIQVGGLKLGPLKVDTVCFSLIPAGSGDVDQCKPTPLEHSFTHNSPYIDCNTTVGDTDQWAVSAEISLPDPISGQFALFGSGTGTTFDSFGGTAKVNIPIVEGVDLTDLGLGMCFTPPITLRGDVGVGLVRLGAGDHLVNIDASVLFKDTYTDLHGFHPWSLTLGGAINVFKVGQVATGDFTVAGNGNFGFDANLQLKFLFVRLDGGVSGSFYPSENKFDMSGNIGVCLVGFGKPICGGADGVVSSIGAAACFTASSGDVDVSAGYGYVWDTKEFKDMGGTCDLTDFHVPAPAIHRMTAAAGAQILTVAPGSHALAFRAFGTNGVPGIKITGPHGTTITVAADAGISRGPGYLALQNPQDGTTGVVLAGPSPGNYTISALDPSNPVTKIETASVLAAFSGHGTVTPATAGRRKLSLRYVLPTGAKLALVERSATGGESAAQQMITPDVHGGGCGAGTKQPEGGRVLCYHVTFTPAHGPGGKREILGVVTRNGLVSTMEPVATYKTANPKLPTRPSALTVRRTGSTVIVRWSASVGATTYGFSAQSPLQTTISRFLPAACHGIRLTGIGSDQQVSVAVAGIRYDGATGHTHVATLKAGKKTAGNAGVPLTGKICH